MSLPVPIQPRSLANTPKRIVLEAAEQRHQAYIGAAAIQRIEFVARTALNAAASVARDEAVFASADPMTAHRYRQIAEIANNALISRVAQAGQ